MWGVSNGIWGVVHFGHGATQLQGTHTLTHTHSGHLEMPVNHNLNLIPPLWE